MAGREYFNDEVNTYNTRIGQIPDVCVASFMKLEAALHAQVSDEDRKLVEASLSRASGA